MNEMSSRDANQGLVNPSDDWMKSQQRANTPTTVPDLDARVSALMALADKHASSGMQITADQFVNRKDPTKARCDHLADYEALEAAIRAALQKPALHELCTWDEAKHVIAAMGYFTSFDSDVVTMQRAIDVVLQGRAKLAQEEITDAELKRIWLGCSSIDNEGFCIEFARKIIRASKGEKT